MLFWVDSDALEIDGTAFSCSWPLVSMYYLFVGLGGVGIGLVLSRLVDFMGSRRGFCGREGEVGGPLRMLSFAGGGIATALLFIGIAAMAPEARRIIHHGGLGVVLITCAEADVRWGIIPNELILAGLLLGGGLLPVQHEPWSFVGAGVVLAGLVFLFRVGSRWLLGRPGFGMGDVKLGVVLGLFLGAQAFWVLYLAVVAAGVVGVVGLLGSSIQPSSRLPFAPFLAVGTLVHWFVLPFSRVTQWLYL